MIFNELIEQEGIENVFSKTNISTENLNRLLNEEFDKLNRVKALGFLLILEREYPDIDVSELRQKIKLYYEEHGPVDDKVVMVPVDPTTGGTSFSFFKLFIIATILGGGYYFYTQGKLDSIVNQVEDKKEFFDDNKALETNATEAEAQKVVVKKSEPQTIQIQTPTPHKEESIANNKDKSNSTTVAKQQASLKESYESKTENNKSVASVVQEVSKDFLANEANKTVDKSQDTTESVVPPIRTVTIHPTRGMLWFGFINLETKKRREFMKKVSTPFTIGNSKWLLVTGHGYVEIISEAKTIENADNKKHYFLIDSTDIKEISKKEFRRLNGHRGW